MIHAFQSSRIGTLSLVIASVILALSGCGGSEEQMQAEDAPAAFESGARANDSESVTYSGQILPLFKKHCSGCHNDDSSIPNWLTYKVAFERRERIYERVVVKKDMPLGGALSDEERELVGRWIRAGAPEGGSAPRASERDPENRPRSGGDGRGGGGGSGGGGGASSRDVTYRKDILPLVRQYCASCHNESSAIPNWLDYETALSRLDRIRERVVEKKDMPLGGGMPDSAREVFAAWIDAGGPEGEGGDGYDSDDHGDRGGRGHDKEPRGPRPGRGSGGGSGGHDGSDRGRGDRDRGDDHRDDGDRDDGRNRDRDRYPPYTGPISYKSPIQGLFKKYCSSCHHATSAIPNWLDYRVAFENQVKLLDRVLIRKDMPLSGTMPDADRELIAGWIRAGAPYDYERLPPPNDPPPAPLPLPPREGQVSYQQAILPLFQRSCSACHNASSTLPNWLDYPTAYEKRDRILERVVIRKDMPLGGSLLEEERDLVERWIRGGAAP
ncbi:MAG: hypothetical protein NDJ89_18315 [Oligoflexia bacterium]|nr:hypothetical protein [Oligoflexia bacterium]